MPTLQRPTVTTAQQTSFSVSRAKSLLASSSRINITHYQNHHSPFIASSVLITYQSDLHTTKTQTTTVTFNSASHPYALHPSTRTSHFKVTNYPRQTQPCLETQCSVPTESILTHQRPAIPPPPPPITLSGIFRGRYLPVRSTRVIFTNYHHHHLTFFSFFQDPRHIPFQLYS